jgi:hypothetical protein
MSDQPTDKELNEFNSGVGCGFTGGFFVAALAVGITLNAVRYYHQCAAIEAGVAEWRVDPKTGQTRFEYLKPAESKP